MKFVPKTCFIYIILSQLSTCFICAEKQSFSLKNTSFFGKEQEKWFDNFYYRKIKPILNIYKRPFTLLDIGDKMHNFSLSAAYDYPNSVVVVMQEDREKTIERKIENLNFENTILLKKNCTLNDLQTLSECEHFDVVLAINIASKYPNKWQKVIKTVVNLGHDVIVDIPFFKKNNAKTLNFLNEFDHTFLGLNSKKLKSDPQYKIYLIRGKRQFLSKRAWFLKYNKRIYKIKCDYSQKLFFKQNNLNTSPEVSEWAPGINLLTYLMCQGAYPSREHIIKSMWNLKETPHEDWAINNMIVQGHQICLIDKNDPRSVTFSDDLFKANCELIQMRDPRRIQQYWRTVDKIAKRK